MSRAPQPSAGEPVREMRAEVRRRELLPAGRPLLVMLSGGRDSVCLLDLAVSLLGAAAVSALHVNYGLREGAAGDERHCRDLCADYGVELSVRRPGAPTLGNLQAWARDVRYGAAAQLALERGALVAAGHTSTDQVETILYRLASSPSRRALLGMRERDGVLVRPLLHFSREQTAAYCTALGLAWRDDESNDSDAYARGRVRHGLVSAMRAVHPGAEANVLAVAELLRDEALVLESLVDEVLRGSRSVPLRTLRELPAALARLVVARLADGARGAPAPGVTRRLDELLLMPDLGLCHLDLPHRVRATARDGQLSFGITPRIERDGDR